MYQIINSVTRFTYICNTYIYNTIIYIYIYIVKLSEVYTRKLNLIEKPLPIKHLHHYPLLKYASSNSIPYHRQKWTIQVYIYIYIYIQRERVLYGLGGRIQSADSKKKLIEWWKIKLCKVNLIYLYIKQKSRSYQETITWKIINHK